MTIPAARVGDLHVCPLLTGIIPHVGGPILPPGKPTVIIMGMPSARIGDMCLCVGPPDVIAMGAATVLIGGLPATRNLDSTVHGGVIMGPGALTVLIGGAAFQIPDNISIVGPPDFQNKVIRDLFLLSTTTNGQALLTRIEASGESVKIIQHPGVNGFCTPNNGADARAGNPTGSVIQYNPDYRSNAFDSAGNMIAQPPQIILGHELVHARNNAEGTQEHGVDPSPPASQPGIDREESSAIGTGSHNGEAATENAIRNDLGLPRRDNHGGTLGPNASEPTPLNLRPGH